MNTSRQVKDFCIMDLLLLHEKSSAVFLRISFYHPWMMVLTCICLQAAFVICISLKKEPTHPMWICLKNYFLSPKLLLKSRSFAWGSLLENILITVTAFVTKDLDAIEYVSLAPFMFHILYSCFLFGHSSYWFVNLYLPLYPVVWFLLADLGYFQTVVMEVMSMIVMSIAPIPA